MATRNGLEPSTSSVTGWRANRLHHRAKRVYYSRKSGLCQAPIFKSSYFPVIFS